MLVLLMAIVKATIAISRLLLLVMPSVVLRVLICSNFGVNFWSASFALLLLLRYAKLLWIVPVGMRLVLMLLKTASS